MDHAKYNERASRDFIPIIRVSDIRALLRVRTILMPQILSSCSFNARSSRYAYRLPIYSIYPPVASICSDQSRNKESSRGVLRDNRGEPAQAAS